MDGAFQANTLRLREHGDIILQELRTARQLCEQLWAAKRLALPEDAQCYEPLIHRAETLARYFGEMGDQVDRTTLELTHLSMEINTLLRDTASDIQRKTSVFHT